jgi:ATP-binding cassette, subfamily F, member 3
MIADITVTEKSFGPKLLMSGIKFSIDDGEKVGVIGRNGVGKSTLFGILTGMDKDFTGEVIYKRGTVVVATAQEHHDLGDTTVLQYVLAGLPEYAQLSHIIETYPETMGDDMKKIDEYTQALMRFDDKGFYQIEEQIERELDNFQLPGVAHRQFSTLSGGQKRLVEVIKIMHSQAQLALVDEPTNHMDYIAKAQFIDWMKQAREAMLVITHDRDVLREVDRIIELKDGDNVSYKGNYDAYLKQNAVSTGSQMNEFEMIEKRIANLKVKVLDYQRLKEKSRNPGTIQKFKRLEETSRKELAELQAKEKPTFWIDKESAANLNYKTAAQYDKFKAKNIRMNLKNDESRSKHVLVSTKDLSLGYGDTPLFEGITIDLREGEALEIRGRNGAGKTTLIKALLGSVRDPRTAPSQNGFAPGPTKTLSIPNQARAADVLTREDSSAHSAAIRAFSGEITLDKHIRIGIYEQEVSPTYFNLPLQDAIERMYLDRELAVSTTKIRGLMSDYLFTEGDGKIPLSKLSGGQKARFQLIAMLANDPQLLILDEPTNHLDLPSIEELETALGRYTGAVLYVSHDGYFRDAVGGEVVQVGHA